MDQRVTRLEEWAKVSEDRMARVEAKLDTIIGRLGELPSRQTLINYFIGSVAVLVAVIAAILGGITFLDARRDDPVPAAPAPVVVYTVPPAADPAPQKRP